MSTIIELEDLSQEISSYDEDLEMDPKKLNEVIEEISVINNLLSKHGVIAVEELQSIREELRAKLDESVELEEEIRNIENQIQKLGVDLLSQASELSQNRIKAIPKFKGTLESSLKDLGIPNARFKIEIREAKTLNASGKDELIFQFTANKGADFKDIKNAASGGEKSRIMLSLKSLWLSM